MIFLSTAVKMTDDIARSRDAKYYKGKYIFTSHMDC